VFDVEKGEGGITLSEDMDSYYKGRLTPSMPYERVCYECADELLSIVEKCNKQCQSCEATLVWGLSIMDCLKFQLRFEVIDLPQQPPPEKGSIEEAKEILRIFGRF
jgi:hypothetical protein